MTEAELLDAIFAAPDDDEPRLVYADWLQERGRPRGELIALQIARARGGAGDLLREEALVAAHRAELVAPLEDALDLADPMLALERGFVTRAAVSPILGSLANAAGQAAWITLRALHGVPYADELFCHDRLRHLDELTGVSVACALALLGDARPRPLRALGIGEPIFPDRTGLRARTTRISDLTAAMHGPGLPRLRRLEVQAPGLRAHPDAFGWLWGTPAGQKLRALVLHVDAPLPPAAPWLEPRAVPAHVQTIELRASASQRVMLGRRDGRLVAWEQ